jgi:hypothetical protein
MTGCVERQRVVEVVVKQACEVGETVFLGASLRASRPGMPSDDAASWIQTRLQT